MRVLILVAMVLLHPGVDHEVMNEAAYYMYTKQATACAQYPTSTACGVSWWSIATHAASIARHCGGLHLEASAVVWHESKGVEGAVGDGGRSIGLMQLAHRYHPEGVEELLRGEDNIAAGCRHLLWLHGHPVWGADYLAHYAGGHTIGFRHLAFQGWVLRQVEIYSKKYKELTDVD